MPITNKGVRPPRQARPIEIHIPASPERHRQSGEGEQNYGYVKKTEKGVRQMNNECATVTSTSVGNLFTGNRPIWVRK